MIRSYTTVDKVDDDKEKSGDSQAKRSKVGSDNSMFFLIVFLFLPLGGFKTWKRPDERFISFLHLYHTIVS